MKNTIKLHCNKDIVLFDQAANAACQSPGKLHSLVTLNCKSFFWAYIQSLWQHHWDTLGQNILHPIVPYLMLSYEVEGGDAC